MVKFSQNSCKLKSHTKKENATSDGKNVAVTILGNRNNILHLHNGRASCLVVWSFSAE